MQAYEAVPPGSGSDEEEGGARITRARSRERKGSVVRCVAIASLASFCFGYHMAVINGPLSEIAIKVGIQGEAAAQGLVISSLLIGATVGSFCCGRIADALGRVKAFVVCAIPLTVGPLVCAASAIAVAGEFGVAFPVVVLGRLVTGTGIGIASSLVPLYIAEVAPAKSRGKMATINQFSICVGILFGLVANLVFQAKQWPAMFMVGILPALVCGMAMCFCPESPRWLALRGQSKQAEKSAMQLWGSGEEVQMEIQELISSQSASLSKQSPSSASILERKYRKVLVVCAMMFVIQQLSGINSVIFFSSAVFKEIGVKSTAAASAMVGLVNVLGTFVATFFIERVGRKIMLDVSYGGLALCLVTMSLGSHFGKPTLVVVGTLLYILAFSTGAGPIPALYVNEIAPEPIRGQASATAFGTHWVMNILIGQTFLPLVKAFGIPAVYAVFAAVALGSLVFSRKVLIETKGKSLDEVSRAFTA